ncbi:MAG: HAD hydrolase-like protein [Anaerolineales bacterium]
MKAVFVHKNAVLRDSHIDPGESLEEWSLMPATFEAVRLLANEETLVFLFGARSNEGEDEESFADIALLTEQIEAGGGRIDGWVCSREEIEEGSEKEFPTIFWMVLSQLDLQLDAGYVLADTQEDVLTAYAAGLRPIMVLSDRHVGRVLGDLPAHKDFPIAPNLTTAVRYIGIEEDTRDQVGHPQETVVPVPSEDILRRDPETLPVFSLTSSRARELQSRATRTRTQLRDIGRWLTFLVLGAVGLSLGIAYLLTHLYRVHPFPEYVYYVTLQFIPRPIRGALFIAWGIGIIYLAVRSFYRSAHLSDRSCTQESD